MADAEPHIQKARHNIEFARKKITGDYADWVIIAEFYSAVHYIESVLAKIGQHSINHTNRYELMCDNPKIFTRRCLCNYKSLEALSKKARYTTDKINNDEASVAQNCYEDICVELNFPTQ